MPKRWKNEKFQQLTEFERERIIGLREGGFSYCAIVVRVQWNISTVMAAQKTGSGQQKGTSMHDDRHLL